MNDSNKICEAAEKPAVRHPKASRPPKRALHISDKARKRLPGLLSFLLPFVIACISFALAMLFTPGRNMPLASDGWHQYYPFLVVFRDKLLHGGSMEYTWISGMGGSFISLFAYYLSSPMYLLSALVPLRFLPQFMTVLTILKLSLAGFFFGWFLRMVYQRNDMMIPFFSMLYAFCAWAVGYYWNIMWLDTFALLPLLIAGTVCLLRDGKFRLYVISLALSLWCSYYIGFFCCIFVLLCFICYNIICWKNFRTFLRRFVRIGLSTLLGAGMACVLLIPTLLAMQTTYSAAAKDFSALWLNMGDKAYGTLESYGSLWEMLKTETIPGIFTAFRKTLTGLLPGQHPTKMEGLPNIFCGLSAVLLAVWFLCCKKIPLREKLVNLGLLGFILLSFILRPLDYIWHGFHFPNMLPYRFSFLFSFVLIAMAYRALGLIDDFKKRYLGVMVPVGLLIIVNFIFSEEMHRIPLVLGSLVLAGMVVFFLLRTSSKAQLKRLATVLLCLILSCEAVVSLAFGIDKVGLTTQVNKTGEVVYPRKNEAVQELLADVRETDGSLFYRMETTGTQTLNDPALNGYNGVSIFNSSTNANFNRLSRSLGLSSWVGSNRFVYYESSPFTNTMCGIKYLLDRDGGYRNTHYNSKIADDDGVNLLQCSTYIGPGFMTNENLGNFVAEEKKYNPIWEQEEMFRLATGIEAPLYDHLTSSTFDVPEGCSLRASGTSGTQYSYETGASDSKTQTLSILYPVEQEGLYIATTKRPIRDCNKVTVYCNDKKLFKIDIKARSLFCVGSFRPGDTLKFEYDIPADKDGALSLDVARQNDEVFDEGFALLADEPFELTELKDGYVKGHIRVLEKGLFYASIPYEPGWSVLVDGAPVEIAGGYDPQSKAVKLTDAVISFPLEAGTHEIEMKYSAPGLLAGALISLISLTGFVVLCIVLRKRPVLLPDPEGSSQKPENKHPLWMYIVLAAVMTLITLACLALQLLGAVKGYAALFPFLAGRKEDRIFLLLAGLIFIFIAITIWLFWRLSVVCRRQHREKAAFVLPEDPESPEDPSEKPEESEEGEFHG